MSPESIELAEVIGIEAGTSDVVYNVVGYHFNVVANNLIVSSHGEDTKGVPEAVFSLGKLVHNLIGAKAARRYYRFFD
jgi:hypothetical protein